MDTNDKSNLSIAHQTVDRSGVILSYLRINSGIELRSAANDTENDILFRRVNRRKNRSSLARLHEYFIGASTAK